MKGLRTAIYKVDQIDKATERYAQAFKTQPYFNEPFYVGFNIGGYELGLQPDDDSNADKTGNVVAYWGVDDIRKEYARLIELGATANEEPENVGGNVLTATVKDPFGKVIGLIHNPHFKVS